MIAYGTDIFGNLISRDVQKDAGGGYKCGANESFSVPPDCPSEKRLIVTNEKWSLINIDPLNIRGEDGIIRRKNQIELMESGLKPLPRGYKIANHELVGKTLEEQLNDKEISDEIYAQLKNQAIKGELVFIDIKCIRSLREYLLSKSDCPNFLKQYEIEAAAKRAELASIIKK